MRTTAVLVALGLLCASPAAAQEAAFDPQARVTEALERVRPVAYHRDRLDWAAIEARARALAAGARDEVDLMPVYQAVVSYLEDNHSSVRYRPGMMDRWRERYGARRMLPDPPVGKPEPTSTFMGRPGPEVTLAPLPGGGRVARVIVPSVAHSGTIPSPYGARLFEALRQSHPQVCGYVVDLRGNTGGDMFPMVVGLSDLVGDGHRIVFVRADGSPMTAVVRSGGVYAVLDDGEEILLDRADGWSAATGLDERPIAVLVDDATGSSGEGAALALIGRANLRTFGTTTAGLASANEPVELSDGTLLMITTAMMTDRLGRTYPDGISPDEAIALVTGVAMTSRRRPCSGCRTTPPAWREWGRGRRKGRRADAPTRATPSAGHEKGGLRFRNPPSSPRPALLTRPDDWSSCYQRRS